MFLFNIYCYFFLFFSVYFFFFFFFLNDPIRVLLSLIMFFTNLAGILLLLGGDFLVVIFLIIYVGAIAMLVLFAIMMLNLNKDLHLYSWKSNFSFLFFSGAVCFFNFKNSVEIFFLSKTEEVFFNSIHFINSLIHEINQIYGIGLIFYVQAYPLFLLSGLVLFLGMVGPIILTLGNQKKIK